MQADNTQEIPPGARPSGDGRFLYPFRGRDYLLTREQYLRQVKLGRISAYILAALGVILALAVILLFHLGPPWRTVVMAGVPMVLVVPLGFYWRTRALLEGCDTREVPNAKGMARADRWLEANLSLYLSKPAGFFALNPPTAPAALLAYGLYYLVIFIFFVSMPWWINSHLYFAAPELVMFAAICLLGSCYWLLGLAVSLYAFCRAIAGNRGKASGPDRPPSK